MAIALPKDYAVYTSLLKEASYGTEAAIGRKHILGSGWSPAQRIATHSPNISMTTGVEGPTAYMLEREHYSGSLPFDYVYPDSIAWALTYVLGAAPTTATVDTGGKQHDFYDLRTSHSLLSFSCQEAIAASTQFKYLGCIATGMTLSKTVGNRASLTVPWIAKELSTDTDTAAVLTDEVPWLNEPVYVRIGTGILSTFDPTAVDVTGWSQGATTDLAATPVDWSGVARSFTIGIDNAIDINNLLTFSGSSLARAERGIRNFSLSNLQVEYDPATPDIDTYIAAIGTASSSILSSYAIEIAWQSTKLCGSATHYYGCKFLFPKVSIASASSQRDPATGKTIVTFETRIQESTGYGAASAYTGNIRAAVWNQVATGVYGA